MKTFSKPQPVGNAAKSSEYDPLADHFGNDFLSSSNGDNPAAIPSIHIKEEKTIYKLKVALPGFTKKDFNIYVDGNMLVISCKKEMGRYPENYEDDFPCQKSGFSYFSRFLSLPENVDSDRIKAKYNGILNLMIPKKCK